MRAIAEYSEVWTAVGYNTAVPHFQGKNKHTQVNHVTSTLLEAANRPILVPVIA
jgi:hypothetical protein